MAVAGIERSAVRPMLRGGAVAGREVGQGGGLLLLMVMLLLVMFQLLEGGGFGADRQRQVKVVPAMRETVLSIPTTLV